MEQGRLLTSLPLCLSHSYGLLNIFISGIEAIAKVRPTAAQLASTWPALQLRWETFFQHSPDKPMAIIGQVAG
jgi:alcohol oxidase